MVYLLKGSEVKNHHNILVVLLKRSSFTQDTLELGVRCRLCAPVSLYAELEPFKREYLEERCCLEKAILELGTSQEYMKNHWGL